MQIKKGEGEKSSEDISKRIPKVSCAKRMFLIRICLNKTTTLKETKPVSVLKIK